MRPFRLINTRELSILQQRIETSLLAWNERHALFPLSCTLETRPDVDISGKGYVFGTEDKHSVALIMEPTFPALSHSVFGEISDCFEPLCKQFFLNLLMQLSVTSELTQQVWNGDTEDWFYTGSPCIAINFRCGEYGFRVYMHPQWVVAALPHNNPDPKPLSDLKQALSSQVMSCQVELNPLTLPLHDLITLKTGDVMTLDHLLDAPLLLKHKEQTLCQVEPGMNLHHKSIQIVSSS